jgi:hypothetical protein
MPFSGGYIFLRVWLCFAHTSNTGGIRKMESAKYLVLVHLASKITRNDLPVIATAVLQAIKANLDDVEAVLTSEAAIAMTGRASAGSELIFRNITGRLRPGDNVSVMELTGRITTSHPGLHAWMGRDQ